MIEFNKKNISLLNNITMANVKKRSSGSKVRKPTTKKKSPAKKSPAKKKTGIKTKSGAIRSKGHARKPSAYNMFVSKFLKGFNRDHPNSRLTQQEKFSMAAKAWRKGKVGAGRKMPKRAAIY